MLGAFFIVTDPVPAPPHREAKLFGFTGARPSSPHDLRVRAFPTALPSATLLMNIPCADRHEHQAPVLASKGLTFGERSTVRASGFRRADFVLVKERT